MARLAYLEELDNNEVRHRVIKGAVAELKEELKELSAALEKVQGLIDASEGRLKESVLSVEIPDHSNGLNMLASQIESLRQAVQSIEIPEVPPFPEIPPYPEQKETDLSGVMSGLAAVREAVTNIKMPEIEFPEKEKREWDFEVVRGANGLIEKVLVRDL